MKITKYLHSCLLVEENNTFVLIDPGMFTYNAKILDIARLPKLDCLLITHSHFDHFHLPFVKELLAKFPQMQIFTNKDVMDILSKENISASIQGNDFIVPTFTQHEKIWGVDVPQNTMFDVFEKLSHPGDSLSFEYTKDILALPITAPWGSTTWAVEVAEKLKPHVIIPIHDWHWKDEVRLGMYDRLEEYFKSLEINFKKPQDGVAIEV